MQNYQINLILTIWEGQQLHFDPLPVQKLEKMGQIMPFWGHLGGEFGHL